MTTRAELIRALEADGLTPEQIERNTGASRQAVRSALKHRGLRPAGRPRERCERCTCAVCGGTWTPRRTRGRKTP